MRFFWMCACSLLLMAGSLEAHHSVGHGGSGGVGFFNPFSTLSRPPQTFLDFSFAFDSLDGDLGEVYTFQLSGEYALHRRFSLGLRVPFLLVREDFISSNGIGDAAFLMKGLLWEASQRLFLSSGLDVSFPTGDESEGLGVGDVVFAPYVTLSKGFRRLELFGTLGSTVIAGDDPRPSLDFATGVSVPVLRDGFGLDLFLALQGSTTFASEILETGSTKIYVKPGVILKPTEAWKISVGGKISAIDTMEVQPGVALAPTSPILLTDVVYGFMVDVNYSF